MLEAVELDSPVGVAVLCCPRVGRTISGGIDRLDPSSSVEVELATLPVEGVASASSPEPVADAAPVSAALGGTTMVLAMTTVVTLLPLAWFDVPVLEADLLALELELELVLLPSADPPPNKPPSRPSAEDDESSPSGTPTAVTEAESSPVVEVAFVYCLLMCRGK